MTNTRLVTTTLLFPKEYASSSPFSLQFLSLDRVRRDAQAIHLVEQFLAGVEELSFCSVLSLLNMHVVHIQIVILSLPAIGIFDIESCPGVYPLFLPFYMHGF